MAAPKSYGVQGVTVKDVVPLLGTFTEEESFGSSPRRNPLNSLNRNAAGPVRDHTGSCRFGSGSVADDDASYLKGQEGGYPLCSGWVIRRSMNKLPLHLKEFCEAQFD